MTILFANNATTQVAGAIDAISTSINVSNGAGSLFPIPINPGDYFVATLYKNDASGDHEIIHVTGVSGDTFTIVRGQEGTLGRDWVAGDTFSNLITAGALGGFLQGIETLPDTAKIYVGVDTSTVPDSIICDTTPVPSALAIGMQFNIRVANTNRGPTLLHLNGDVAGKAAVRTNASPLVGGNLHIGEETIFIYNGAHFTTTIPPIRQEPPQYTFYVRIDGNDNNSGFANTPADAFRTICGAKLHIEERYSSQGQIQIKVSDGTYDYDGPYFSEGYIGQWYVLGNAADPSRCVINAVSTNGADYPAGAAAGFGCAAHHNGDVVIEGFTFHSYYCNISGGLGGTMEARNCHYTAPLAGWAPIDANDAGTTRIWGVNTYTPDTNVTTLGLMQCTGGGVLDLGFKSKFSAQRLDMQLGANTAWSDAGIVVLSGGIVQAVGSEIFITGSVPAARCYFVDNGGGIEFGDLINPFVGKLGSAGVIGPKGWTEGAV